MEPSSRQGHEFERSLRGFVEGRLKYERWFVVTNLRGCKNALVIRCDEGALHRDELATRTKFSTLPLSI